MLAALLNFIFIRFRLAGRRRFLASLEDICEDQIVDVIRNETRFKESCQNEFDTGPVLHKYSRFLVSSHGEGTLAYNTDIQPRCLARYTKKIHKAVMQSRERYNPVQVEIAIAGPSILVSCADVLCVRYTNTYTNIYRRSTRIYNHTYIQNIPIIQTYFLQQKNTFLENIQNTDLYKKYKICTYKCIQIIQKYTEV